MKNIIQSTIIGAITLIIALMILKSLKPGNFKSNTSKWAAQSFENSNLISIDKMNALNGNVLIVDLKGQEGFFKENLDMIQIPADSLLSKENYKKIRSHKGSIVLSGDLVETAQMWMILSQMGTKDLYILSDN